MLRLKELREDKQISQKEMARVISKTPQAYSLYENGKRSPDIDTLIALAKFFQVSIDYLVGYVAPTAQMSGCMDRLNRDEQTLLRYYRAMRPNYRFSVQKYVEFTLKEDQQDRQREKESLLLA